MCAPSADKRRAELSSLSAPEASPAAKAAATLKDEPVPPKRRMASDARLHLEQVQLG